MDAEEELNRLRTVYMDRLKRRDSLAEASRRLGVNEGFLANQKNHKRGLRSGDALRSLRVLGCALPEELYHEVFFSEDTDPAGILAYSREHQNLKPDPFVVELLPRLEALAAAGPGPDGGWASLEGEIRLLDHLRRRDRPAAKEQLQLLLTTALDCIEAGSRPTQALIDICEATAVLVAICRLGGRRDDAVDLLVSSYPLTLSARSFKIQADWWQKAAYLLVDLHRNARARSFLLKAHHLYDLIDAPKERVRTLVDIAYVLTDENKHAESSVLLEKILHRLAMDHEGLFSAHQLLAVNFHSIGNIQASHLHLDKAIDLVGDDVLAKAYCLSRRAEFLVARGDLAAAQTSYREALPLFARVAGAAELMEVAMEYALLLLRQDNRAELRQLARELSVWSEQMKGNLKLRAAIEDFQALMRLEDTNDQRITTICEQIAAINRAYMKAPSRKA